MKWFSKQAPKENTNKSNWQDWRPQGTIIANVQQVQKINFRVTIVGTILVVMLAFALLGEKAWPVFILGILSLIGATIYFKTFLSYNPAFVWYPIILYSLTLVILLFFTAPIAPYYLFLYAIFIAAFAFVWERSKLARFVFIIVPVAAISYFFLPYDTNFYQKIALIIYIVGMLIIFYYQINSISREVFLQRQEAEQIKQLYEQLKQEKMLVSQLLSHERIVNHQKNQFITLASHHLRTPLTIIKNYLELSKKNSLNTSYLLKMQEGVRRLDLVCEELITLANLESGRLKPVKLECNIGNIINLIAQNYTNQIEAKNITFKIEESIADLPEIQADNHFIKVLFTNLIDNAIKFTPDYGSVRILGRIENNFLTVTISDTGPGILPQDLSKLFAKFSSVEDSFVYQHQGLGLGLYIVKLIAEAHGGKILVQSTPGKGSSFIVYLPLLIHSN